MSEPHVAAAHAAKRVNHVRFVNRQKANAPGVQPGTPNEEPALSLFVRALYDAIVTVAFERDTVFCLLLNIQTLRCFFGNRIARSNVHVRAAAS